MPNFSSSPPPRYKHLILSFLLLINTGLLSSVVLADHVYWTDWTTKANTEVSGNIAIGTNKVNVTFSGSYSFAQTDGGTNYWNPSAPYLSTLVSNEPSDADIIALHDGGAKTIKFSQSVHNPLIALVSWNGNTVDFGVPIHFLSYEKGYWGSGTPVVNAAGTGFYGKGEVHGVIELIGDYTSITFTDTSEHWHGLTVGIAQKPVTLTVSKAGTGTGTVTSDGPIDINCGSDCSEVYPVVTYVTLATIPATGSVFSGWSGDPDCTDAHITVDADKTCTATFVKVGSSGNACGDVNGDSKVNALDLIGIANRILGVSTTGTCFTP